MQSDPILPAGVSAADFAKALVLAKAGDTPGLVEQFKKATGNCDACHTDFRGK